MRTRKSIKYLILAIVSILCMSGLSFAGINNKAYFGFKVNGVTRKTFSSMQMYTGEVYTIQAVDLFSPGEQRSSVGSIEVKSNRPSIANVKKVNAKTVKVTAKKAGKAKLTVTIKDKSGLKNTRDITVTVKENSIRANYSSICSGSFVTYSLNHTKGITSYAWRSSRSAVAKPMYNKKSRNVFQVGMLKNGSSVISVKVNGVTVKKTAVVNKYTSRSSVNLKAGKGKQLRLAMLNAKYRTSNSRIASVDSKGNIVAKRPGTATVTATGKVGNRYTNAAGSRINFNSEINFVFTVNVSR